MRVVVQRCSRAEVRIDGTVVGKIGQGFMLLVGITETDTRVEAELLAESDMTNFIWSTGETTPQITVYQSGTYYVTVSDGICGATGHITVPACDCKLYLPNAITPTQENGINDYFFIPQHSHRQINTFEIIIYNRWGEMVFRSEDKNFRWHGDSNGKIMANTTYTYVIRWTNNNGKECMTKGIITVL